MSLARGSVNRPVTVLMATIAVSTFGFLAAQRLPIELLPDLAYPTLTLQTEYPDAAPESVEQFVTRPLEEAVGVITGVREMRSVSRPGLSEVILEFDWGEEMDLAAIEVRERLGVVQLPREAESPRVLRFDPSLDPIVRLGLSGPDRELDDLRQLAERWIKPRLEGVRGIAAAKIRGGLDPEVVVEADEDRLAALGLTLDDLARALEAENVNQPGGVVRDVNALYLVRTLHEFNDLEQLRRTVVRESAEGRVRVEDVALVRRWHRDREEISRVEGQEIVELALHREGSANTVTVANAVFEELEELRSEMPESLSLTVLSDQSEYIAEAVNQVKGAAWFGGLLAILVLYFFLRDAPSTGIIALSIPVSVIATFLPMHQAGVTLNIMSLGGLALGIGMLVDSSIVVLESIDRHRRLGKSRREAAIVGTGEVAGAVVASTLTTVSVFLPIVFVQGVAGQLFRDQALTVCFSLLAALVVSLTVIPALSAIGPLRRKNRHGEEDLPWTLRLGPLELPPIGDGFSVTSRLLTVLLFPLRFAILLVVAALGALGWVFPRLFFGLTSPLTRANERANALYPGLLSRALDRRATVLVIAFALLAGSLWLLPRLGTRLVPNLSQGEFAFQLRLPEGTPLSSTADAVSRLESALVGDPLFERVFSTVGSLPSSASGQRTLGENLAQLDFVLPEEAGSEWEAVAVARVRSVLEPLQKIDAELVRPSVLSVKPPVAVRLFSDDLAQLTTASELVESRLARLPELEDVGSTAEPGSPEVQVELDRERAATLGLTAADIGQSLRRKIGGELIGQFREGEERIDIRLRALEPFRDRAAEVQNLRLRLPDGVIVPVSALAHVEVGRGPAAIHRAEGSRMAEITAETRGEDLGVILEGVRAELLELQRPAAADGADADQRIPEAVRVEMAGQDQELALSFQSLQLALALAIFLVYVVMAAQFESLIHPFVILSAVPLALVGIVAALWLTNHTISVLALIGAVMLAGIVVNNAIVLVDAINRRRREEGQALRDAVIGAGQERLRPILMTTATTVLGLMPMAIGLGAGAELRAPLAITVIGGLVVATLLTLVVVPCIYELLTTATGSDAATVDPPTEGSGPQNDDGLDTPGGERDEELSQLPAAFTDADTRPGIQKLDLSEETS